MSLLTGLIAAYNLDEPSGNAVDSSGNAHTLTNTNVTYAPGLINNGAVFDSTTDSLATSSGSSFDFERTDSFTISAWANWISLANNGYIASHINPNANFNGWSLQAGASGEINFNIANNGDGSNILYMRAPNGSLSAGAYKHVVVTYDGSSTPGGVHIYVNTSDIALTTIFNNLSATAKYTGPFQLGSREGSSINMAATMDIVGVWSRVLTAAEVSTLYNAGAGVQYPFGVSTNNSFLLMGV